MTEFNLMVFDFDGVIIDSEVLMAHAFVAACERAKVAQPPEFGRFLKCLGQPLPDIADALGLPPEFVREYQSVAKERMSLVVLHSGAASFLREAKQCFGTVALMTGKDRLRTTLLLERFGLDKTFAASVCGDDRFLGKPNPHGLIALIEKLSTDPSHTATIGDSPIDIQCGLAAGVFTIGAGWGFCSVDELSAAGAHAVFQTPSEFRAWMSTVRATHSFREYCKVGTAVENVLD